MILKNIKTLLSEDSFLEKNTGAYIIASVFFAFIAYCFYINSSMNSNINLMDIEALANQSSLIKNSIIMTAALIMVKLSYSKHITVLNMLLISSFSLAIVFIFEIKTMHAYMAIIPLFALLLTLYIENKSTDKIYYLIIGLILVITNSTFISTIGMGFFQHMQSSEIQKIKNDIRSMASPCQKYQCIVFEDLAALNINDGNSEFYKFNRYSIEDKIKNKSEEFHLIDERSNALMVAKRTDNITTVVIEKEKINMFKNVSITWINFLSIIAGAFWVYMGFILLHYHKNRKIRVLANSKT